MTGIKLLPTAIKAGRYDAAAAVVVHSALNVLNRSTNNGQAQQGSPTSK
ncbi:MAG: hypothetical protein WC455_21040 [Dehalococcoidia bacterium]|jgi:hypothetical protein